MFLNIFQYFLALVVRGGPSIYIFLNIFEYFFNTFEAGWYVVVRLLHAGVESENGGGNLTHELKLRG